MTRQTQPPSPLHLGANCCAIYVRDANAIIIRIRVDFDLYIFVIVRITDTIAAFTVARALHRCWISAGDYATRIISSPIGWGRFTVVTGDFRNCSCVVTRNINPSELRRLFVRCYKVIPNLESSLGKSILRGLLLAFVEGLNAGHRGETHNDGCENEK